MTVKEHEDALSLIREVRGNRLRAAAELRRLRSTVGEGPEWFSIGRAVEILLARRPRTTWGAI